MKITTILVVKPIATFVYFFLFFSASKSQKKNVVWIYEANTKMEIMNQTEINRQKKQTWLRP